MAKNPTISVASGQIDTDVKDYINTIVAPKNRKSIKEAFKGLTPIQKSQRLASFQQADQEFISDIGPRMPTHMAAPDVSKARVIGFERGLKDSKLNLRGLYIDPRAEENHTETIRDHAGERHTFEFEPDTVTAVGAHNANPALFAHEYTHRGDKRRPHRKIYADTLMSAQNDTEALKAIQSIANQAGGKKGKRVQFVAETALDTEDSESRKKLTEQAFKEFKDARGGKAVDVSFESGGNPSAYFRENYKKILNDYNASQLEKSYNRKTQHSSGDRFNSSEERGHFGLMNNDKSLIRKMLLGPEGRKDKATREARERLQAKMTPAQRARLAE
jgi:hypothetical protein